MKLCVAASAWGFVGSIPRVAVVTGSSLPSVVVVSTIRSPN